MYWFEYTVALLWALLEMLIELVRSWCRFFYVQRKCLTGEIVLLTGAAGGIGRLLAKKLAQKGI